MVSTCFNQLNILWTEEIIKPVGIGSLSHYLPEFYASQVVSRISSINSMMDLNRREIYFYIYPRLYITMQRNCREVHDVSRRPLSHLWSSDVTSGLLIVVMWKRQDPRSTRWTLWIGNPQKTWEFCTSIWCFFSVFLSSRVVPLPENEHRSLMDVDSHRICVHHLGWVPAAVNAGDDVFFPISTGVCRILSINDSPWFFFR